MPAQPVPQGLPGDPNLTGTAFGRVPEAGKGTVSGNWQTVYPDSRNVPPGLGNDNPAVLAEA
jgi:hypothetical protein